jgi:hypothetical protein
LLGHVAGIVEKADERPENLPRTEVGLGAGVADVNLRDQGVLADTAQWAEDEESGEEVVEGVEEVIALFGDA